jgi:hypothetical protein
VKKELKAKANIYCGKATIAAFSALLSIAAKPQLEFCFLYLLLSLLYSLLRRSRNPHLRPGPGRRAEVIGGVPAGSRREATHDIPQMIYRTGCRGLAPSGVGATTFEQRTSPRRSQRSRRARQVKLGIA